MKRLRTAILLCLLISGLWFPSSGHAACFSPAGNAGDVIYYGGYQSDMYCNGGAWISMGGPVGNTTNGLVAWWKLDDGAGTSAVDSSGNGNTGTLNNSPTWTTSGMNGGALTFNGTNQYVDAGDPASLQLAGSWTVSTWFNPSTLPSSGHAYFLLDKEINCCGGNPQNYRLMLSNSYAGCTGLAWSVNFDTTSFNQTSVCYPMSVSAGTWYLITGVWNSASSNLYLYLNGSLVGTTNATFIPPASGPGLGNHLDLGRESSNGSYSAGTLDDARVYNRALSAQDVMTLYTSTGGPSPGRPVTQIEVVQGTFTSHVATPTFGTATTYGELVVVQTYAALSGSAIVSVTDNQGDTYTQAFESTVLSGHYEEGLWYLANAPPGVSTITVTENSADSNGVAIAGHYAGIVTTSPLDQSSAPSSTSSPSPWSSGTVTTTQAAELLIGGVTVWGSSGNCSLSPGGNWSSDIMDNAGSFSGANGSAGMYSHQIVSTIQTNIQNTGTTSGCPSPNNYPGIATFKAVTGCTSPAGYAGDLLYNNVSHVPQFCNGSTWIPEGPVPGAGGSGCSSPTGNEGDFVYNASNLVMQYCDGANWVAAGENVPISGLVGWWNFDEGSGTSLADSSGYGNTGTLCSNAACTAHSTTGFWVAGKINDAGNFNGTSQYVDVANQTPFNFDINTPFTLAAWIYRNSSSDTDDEIFAKIKQSSGSPGYSLWMTNDGAAGHPCDTADAHDKCTTNCLISQWLIPSHGVCLIAPTTAAAPGAWHHVAMTYDGAGGEILYVDGAAVTSYAVENDFNGSMQNTADLLIGQDVTADSDWFGGKIDDARVYNRALSASEVWRLYNGAP